jgi:hypothetical protein
LEVGPLGARRALCRDQGQEEIAAKRAQQNAPGEADWPHKAPQRDADRDGDDVVERARPTGGAKAFESVENADQKPAKIEKKLRRKMMRVIWVARR